MLTGEQIEGLRERLYMFRPGIGEREINALCDLALSALAPPSDLVEKLLKESAVWAVGNSKMMSLDLALLLKEAADALSVGWIPVSELPENDEPVLVWNRVKDRAEIGTRAFLFRWMRYHQHNGGSCDWTHWMNLPEPPK